MDEEPDGYDVWLAEQRLSHEQRTALPLPRRRRRAPRGQVQAAVVPFVAILVALVGAMIWRWSQMH